MSLIKETKSIRKLHPVEFSDSKIGEAEILSDFDKTEISEESAYSEVFAYLRNRPDISLLKNIISTYVRYKRTGDVKDFYSLFHGCPVEVLDQIALKLHQRQEWEELMQKERIKKVGIVSRNNKRIIQKFIENPKHPGLELSIVAANIPEIKDGIYTGKVEVIVNNENLSTFISDKGYICRNEERRIVEKDEGIRSESKRNGFYICWRKKIF